MSQPNIELLLKYADEYNMTIEQRASMLAIIGGECEWKLKSESPKYRNVDKLLATFPSAFKGNRDMAAKWVGWKGDPKEFFNFVYAPGNGGARIGNVNLDDGQKYRGRGFIQITGRSNYEWAQKAIFSDPMFKGEYDVVKDPDLMLIPDIAARVAVVWFCHMVPKTVSPSAHPAYFYTALDNININYSPATRRKIVLYYEHFYGVMLPESFRLGEKSAVDSFSTYDTLLDNSSFGQTPQLPLGFSKNTPRRNKHRPERSKLASGISVGTIIEDKQSKRKMGIEIATPSTGNSRSWDQPSVPFGARYPFNHVRETRSGHIQEFDDTPGYERIHTYHKAGTFEEIDAQGTKVTRVVGDNYTIVDNNGYIYISGSANVTVTGDINIICKSHATIDVRGSAEARFGGNLQLNVARDMDVAVGGTFSLWGNKGVNLQSATPSKTTDGGPINIRSGTNLYACAEQEMDLVANKNLLINSTTRNTHILSNGDTGKVLIGAKKRVHIKSDDKVLIGADEVHVGGGSSKTYVSSDNEVNIHSASVNIEGTTDINMNKDAVDPATPPVMAAAGTKPVLYGMTVIPPQFPTNRYLEPLIGPALHGEDTFMYESPEEADGDPVLEALKLKGQMTYGNPKNIRVEATPIVSNGGSGNVSSNHDVVLSADAKNFTGSYVLAEAGQFKCTLDMMFDGGFNRTHHLRDQRGITATQIVTNLTELANNIIIKALPELTFHNWQITSGYRDAYGNVPPGSSTKSDHYLGRAVDIQLQGLGAKERAKAHYDLALKLAPMLPYHQFILEYWYANAGAPHGDTSWLHISYSGPGTFGESFITDRTPSTWTYVNHVNRERGFVLYQ